MVVTSEAQAGAITATTLYSVSENFRVKTVAHARPLTTRPRTRSRLKIPTLGAVGRIHRPVKPCTTVHLRGQEHVAAPKSVVNAVDASGKLTARSLVAACLSFADRMHNRQISRQTINTWQPRRSSGASLTGVTFPSDSSGKSSRTCVSCSSE